MSERDPLPTSIAGRYRVVSLIGSGGMGVVYKAIDSALDRPVAIKAIHRHRLGDRRGRLREEALAAASIDHPYLCKVYELIEDGDDSFLVMEYVEGETLASVLTRGPLPLDRTLAIGAEVAEALATAHARGLVHRDVKPSNVMVTANGHVKLLDFGLARSDVASPAEAATHTSPGGRDFAGTPRYMAPEQAQGRAVTARADLFAFGVLLYECVSGRLPFAGESGYDYARHVIASPATSLAVVAPAVPEDLARLIHRCLEKAPVDRPESADEIRGALERIADAAAHDALPTAGAARRRRQLRLAALAAAIVVVLAWGGWRWLASPGTTPVLSQSRPLVTWPSDESDSRVSPDGRFVAFLSQRGGSPNVYVVPATGGDETPVRLPAGAPESFTWSPDGNHLAVLLRRSADSTWRVVAVPIFGGPVVHSLAIEPTSFQITLLRWRERSVYVQIGASLQRLDLDTGSLTAISDGWTLAGRLTYVDVSADGRRVAYTLVADGRTDLWIADLDGDNARRLTDDDAFERFPVWHASGRAVVYQSNRRGQIDLWEWRLDGGAVPLTSSQGADTPGGLSSDGAVLSFSREMDEADLWMWSAPGDPGRQVTADTRRDYAPSLSPDGRVAVFQRSRPTAVRGSLFDSTLVAAAVTSSGLDEPREVDEGFAACLSRDGTWLAYFRRGAPGRLSLLVRRLDTDEVETVSDTVPLLSFFSSTDDWSERNVAWSGTDDTLFFVDELDGRWTVRRYRQDGDPAETLVTVASGETVRDLFLAADGSTVTYLVHSNDEATTWLRRLDLDTRQAHNLARLEATGRREVVGRGWLGGDGGFVLIRQGALYDDDSRDLDVLVAGGPGQVRTATVLDRAFVGTVRLDAAAGVLYYAAVESGVHNLFAVDLDSGDRWPVTTNTLEGVIYSAPALDRTGRLLGVRHRLTHDIWILDARPPSDTTGGTP